MLSRISARKDNYKGIWYPNHAEGIIPEIVAVLTAIFKFLHTVFSYPFILCSVTSHYDHDSCRQHQDLGGGRLPPRESGIDSTLRGIEDKQAWRSFAPLKDTRSKSSNRVHNSE